MRGLLATLSVLSSLASVAVAFAATTTTQADLGNREVLIVLWATTLSVGAVTGAAARKMAARQRAGLARSSVSLVLCVLSLVVGVVGFLL